MIGDCLLLTLLAFSSWIAVPQYVSERFENGNHKAAVSGDSAADESRVLKYRIMKPDPIREGKKYPMILWLNEIGTRHKNKKQLCLIHETITSTLTTADSSFFVLAPDISHDPAEDEDMRAGDPPILSERLVTQVDECLDEVISKLPVDRNRIYVIGLHDGGGLGWEYALRFPARPAALLTFNSALRPAENLKDLKQLPVWSFYSSEDPRRAIASTTNIISELNQQGGKAELTQSLADVIDPDDDEQYSCIESAFSTCDLLPWLFSQSLQIDDAPPPGEVSLSKKLEWQYWKLTARRWGPLLLMAAIAIACFQEVKRRRRCTESNVG